MPLRGQDIIGQALYNALVNFGGKVGEGFQAQKTDQQQQGLLGKILNGVEPPPIQVDPGSGVPMALGEPKPISPLDPRNAPLLAQLLPQYRAALEATQPQSHIFANTQWGTSVVPTDTRGNPTGPATSLVGPVGPKPQSADNLSWVQKDLEENGKPVAYRIGYDPHTGEEKVRQRIGTPYEKPTGAGVSNEPPIDPFPGLSGQELLQKLGPGEKALVQSIGEGRAKIQNATTYRGNRKEYLQRLVQRVYPTYDQRWVDSSYALTKDATSGNIAKNARSLNTAIGHLDQFYAAGKALENVDFTGYNSLANWIKAHTGDPRVLAVQIPAEALAAEFASATKGGASGAAGTEAEIKGWAQNFSTSLSNAQFDEAANSGLKILGSRIGNLQNQYDKVPYHPAGFEVLSPAAKQILQNFNFDYSKYESGATGTTPQSGKSAFTVGQIYIDGSGNKAKYLGNDKWEEVK